MYLIRPSCASQFSLQLNKTACSFLGVVSKGRQPISLPALSLKSVPIYRLESSRARGAGSGGNRVRARRCQLRERSPTLKSDMQPFHTHSLQAV